MANYLPQTCPGCGHPLSAGYVAGDVRLTVIVRGGRKTEHAAPICADCAEYAMGGVVPASAVLKWASERMLEDVGDAAND